jgi:adenosylhomocysteine nucleosidase
MQRPLRESLVKVLVTFALESEFAPWRKRHSFRESRFVEAPAFTSSWEGIDLTVVLTGAGPRQAAEAAASIPWPEWEEAGLCISAGLAGALRPEYLLGDLLAARSVLAAACSEPAVESDADLISLAGQCGARIVNRFLTAGEVVGTTKEKQRLGELADAVEMESFELLKEASVRGIPAVAVRAVSDTLDEDLPLDMNQIFTDAGQVSIPRVLGQVARRPQALPGLMRLGRQSQDAAKSLARFLDAYLPVLAARKNIGPMKSAVLR